MTNEEIMREAEELEDRFGPVWPAVAGAIRDAVLMEREACAKLAEERAAAWKAEFDRSNHPTHWVAFCEARDIAAAIRTPKGADL